MPFNTVVHLQSDENQRINQRIKDFARAMSSKNQSTQYYTKYRKAINPFNNIFLGKKAEYIAMKGLSEILKFPTLNIDLEIRTGNNKGWQTDLLYHKQNPAYPNGHVKGCNLYTYNLCKDYSWTFQYANQDTGGGKDPILNSLLSDLVILVYMRNAMDADGTIMAILSVEQTHKHLRDPIIKRFKGIKKCIYYKDLIDAEF